MSYQTEQQVSVLAGRHVPVIRDPNKADALWDVDPKQGPIYGGKMGRYVEQFFKHNPPTGHSGQIALIVGPAKRHVYTGGWILKETPKLPWYKDSDNNWPMIVQPHGNEINFGLLSARQEQETLEEFKNHAESIVVVKRYLTLEATRMYRREPDKLKKFKENLAKIDFSHGLERMLSNFEVLKKSGMMYTAQRPGGNAPADVALHQTVVLDQMKYLQEEKGIHDFVYITSGGTLKCFYLEATQQPSALYNSLHTANPGSFQLYKREADAIVYDAYGNVFDVEEKRSRVKDFRKRPRHKFVESYPDFAKDIPELVTLFPDWKIS